MAQLSDNFRFNELCCPCCGAYLANPRLLDALEALRSELGDVPIHVNSGTRCPEWNKKVGGVSKSKHLLGEAADIVVRGKEPIEVAKAAESVTQLRNGGVGVYESFTHVDVGHGASRPARWSG